MKTRRIRDGYGGEGIVHWCPGCDSAHIFWHSKGTNPQQRPCWTYDGNRDTPTCSPSMLITYQGDDETPQEVCHYFLRTGVIEFLGDCTHAMKGTNVPLPDWPYAPGMYGGIEEDG